MNVSSIMTKDVITVNKKTSLKEAAGLLAKFRIHGFPVVDDNNKVVGIFTKSDFFNKDDSNIFLPSFLGFIRDGDIKSSQNAVSKEVGENTKVEDIMTHKCICVQPETEIEELVNLFKNRCFNSIPVADKEGNLVGIVTVIDVIRLL
jgi:CBS-domain-containing membrane protein